uniref:Si:ch211-155i14.1 n=1 Tax=Nothobranchius korthausae TaxID=1143690 RepID=A0A1A8FMQ8_9TELE
MDGLKPPAQWSMNAVNLPKAWKTWKEEFTFYTELALPDAEEKARVKLFYYLIGERGRELCGTLIGAEARVTAGTLDEMNLTDTPVALLTVVADGAAETSPVHFSPSSMAVVVEGDLVIRDIARFADAYALLFGLIYALHLDYPRKLVHTFTFVQKVFMGLDDGKPLKPRLHAQK